MVTLLGNVGGEADWSNPQSARAMEIARLRQMPEPAKRHINNRATSGV
jgi:hypothetical protein